MKSFFGDLGKSLKTGVSYFLPVVVIFGILTAISQIGSNGVEVQDPFMSNIANLANAASSVMIPVLAAYIAYGLAGRPALAPGFVLGYVANSEWTVPFLPAPEEGATAATMKTGFLGAMLLAIAIGFLVRWMKTWKVGKNILPIMPIIIIPIIATFIVGLVYVYVIGYPIYWIMEQLTGALVALNGVSAVALGAALGAMVAFDMGGPINKTAAMFCLTLFSEEIYEPAGAFVCAVAVAPLGLALSVLLARKKYDTEDVSMGITAAFMGIIGITEGAIPFAVKDFKRVIPTIVVGSAITGGIAMATGVASTVPHGGLIVTPLITNWPMYLLAMAVGIVFVGVVLAFWKPNPESPVEVEEIAVATDGDETVTVVSETVTG
ncbi:MAG: PTS fructose transporter subunit IIC [Bifidobacteriaceae bacterium]|jgi:PTS system fructose-specific IIC component/fructose-specific PTS system IIC-like component|nr:PTS fructose transporter subunit IIC [Bifidobacteriaceae bacterium]